MFQHVSQVLEHCASVYRRSDTVRGLMPSSRGLTSPFALGTENETLPKMAVGVKPTESHRCSNMKRVCVGCDGIQYSPATFVDLIIESAHCRQTLNNTQA